MYRFRDVLNNPLYTILRRELLQACWIMGYVEGTTLCQCSEGATVTMLYGDVGCGKTVLRAIIEYMLDVDVFL